MRNSITLALGVALACLFFSELTEGTSRFNLNTKWSQGSINNLLAQATAKWKASQNSKTSNFRLAWNARSRSNSNSRSSRSSRSNSHSNSRSSKDVKVALSSAVSSSVVKASVAVNCQVLDVDWTGQCVSMDIASNNYKRKEIKLPRCKAVKAITLNNQASKSKCEFGKSYGFDGQKVFATAGCRGNFRVCCEPSTNRGRCRNPYVYVEGKCLLIERNKQVRYREAARQCSERGGRLLIADDLVGFSSKIRSRREFRKKRFFVGGAKIFASLKGSKLNEQAKTNVDAQFALKLTQKFKVSQNDAVNSLRRFCGVAKIEDWNRKTKISSQCITMDFNDENGPALVDCNKRSGYICEEIERNKDGAGRWTPWISQNGNPRTGETEYYSKIAKAALKGQLKGHKNIRLCKRPIGMQCREKGTKKLYSKDNQHGLKLDAPCTQNKIVCWNKRQSKGKTCPDFEVRFQCPDNGLDDCSVESVRKDCEQRKRQCKNTAFGARCVKPKRRRSGRERIGGGTCTLNNIQYELFECASRGDPHYFTFDGTKIDFMGVCSYNLASTCQGYVPTNDFPEFQIISMNTKNDPSDKVSTTKAFSFSLNGVKYTFTRGEFFVNDLKRNAVDYSDGQIDITAEQKGSSTKLTINTQFCLSIRWDNRAGLYVNAPSAYKNHICGICGSFDGNPSNDRILPGTNKPASNNEIGKYHEVSNPGAGKCNDIILSPPECSDAKKKEFNAPKYCGVFDPNGDSPFVKIVLDGSVGDAIETNKARLGNYLTECILDHCWMRKFTIGRCHEMEHIIEEIRLELAIDNANLDKAWRAYADCEKSPEERCGDSPNMQYQSSYKRNCQNTCADRMKSLTCDDEETTQGCVCKDGFYMDPSLKCVKEEECDKSCTVTTEHGETVIINDGATVVVEPCKSTVTCKGGEAVENLMEPCSEHADCIKGGTECSCKRGYDGDGHYCEPDRSCRKGYFAHGSKCYKLVRDKLDWHSAAINCGSDGAQLARYDTDVDEELENFFERTPELYLLASASSRKIYCKAGRNCNIPSRQLALSARVKDSKWQSKCAGKYTISNDRRKLVVTGKDCKTNFIVETISPSKFANPKDVVAWVGGNTEVLGGDKRKGRAPFQVDPPRLIDLTTFPNQVGCFQASSNEKDEFIISPNPNCQAFLPSICEYDNTKENTFNPLDFKGIKERTNFEGAVAKCKNLGRPLATIANKEQLERAKKILSDLGRDGWLSLRWYQDKMRYEWANGAPLEYSNFRDEPQPNYRDKQLYCVSMNRRNGAWNTEKCTEKDMYPLCGPPLDITPTVFSPYYSAKGVASLTKLRQKFQKEGSQDYVCQDPAIIECSAKTKAGGRWVTNDRQQGQTLTCTAKSLSCKDGQEFDCDTFRVRFLCPQNDNQCSELQELGSTPCDGGRNCFPISNHYICKCPHGTQFSTHANKCKPFCGVCSLWGDPHYTGLGNTKFDFMGTCKYKLAGVCNADEFGDAPYFDILTKNKLCGKKKGAACVNKLEVKLFNIPIERNGATIKKDFSFRVNVGASSYKLNSEVVKLEEYKEKNAFHVVLKKAFFELTVHRLDLSVLLSGTKLKIKVPGDFRDKMCGLCGDCGTPNFKAANGTEVVIPKDKKGKWNRKIIAQLGTEYVVFDDEAEEQKCEIPPVPDKEDEGCTKEMEAKVSGPSMCGIFMDENGPFKECFSTTDMNPQEYFEDCVTDVCLQSPDNMMDFVCNMAKTVAGECLTKSSARPEWRKPDFCPMNCGDKLYRVDASCELKCGQSMISRQMCNEEPEEGCVCPDGKMKQGDKCVDPKDCGCKIMLDGDRASVNLAPNEKMYMPGCEEEAYCFVGEDGSQEVISNKLDLDPNIICSKFPPVELKCAKGFILNDDGVSCSRDPEGCIEGYEDMSGMCVKTPPNPRIWRSAVEACNEEDGTLVLVDTEVKLESLKNVMIDKKFNSLYISGRVVASKVPGSDEFKIEPLLGKDEQSTVAWANFDFHESIKDQIIVSDSIDPASVSDKGVVLSLVARLSEDKESVIIVAVSSDTPSNFVCEQRKLGDDDTQWFGPCNTDSNMEDDGDQETRMDMIMDPKCEVCPVPMEVKCEAVEGGKGDEEGQCKLTASGVYYYCDQGSQCIDKAVSTKCAKDADECATKRDDCPENSKCINTPGAYICKCNDDKPLMVNGKCEASQVCTMSGPSSNTDYDYVFRGFSGPEGLFDYDCKFKFAVLCEGADKDLPDDAVINNVYVVSTRMGNELMPSILGVIGGVNANKFWRITPDLMLEGKFMYNGQKTTLGFYDSDVQSRFSFLSPGTLIIENANNYFRTVISFPTRIETEYSQVFKDKMCGLCTMEPSAEGKIVLSDTDVGALKLPDYPRCQPRVEEEEPEATTQAPEESTTPQAEDPCSEKEKAACESLNKLCGVDIARCERDICENEVAVCLYMANLGPVRCQVGSDLKNFIQQQECEAMCDSNMQLKYSSRSMQPSCTDLNRRPVMSESSTSDSVFACICDEGFVQSGNKCVRKEDCGCTIAGRYYPPGAVIRNSDCSEVSTCVENNNVDTVNRPCGPNTKCVTNDDGSNCECDENMFGNPNSAQGCEEGTVSEDGSKTCFNYYKEDGLSEEKCECNMGYVSNCDDCEDIDECQEGIHACDLSNQVCVNEKGGYKCECAKGYKKDANGVCKDIDECADSNPCDKTSQCVNSVGSFECICCAGYVKTSAGCVRDNKAFPTLPENAKCCAICNDADLCQESEENPIPYCYVDQDGNKKQYPSYERLYQELCLANKQLDPSRLSRGKCSDDSGPGGPGGNPDDKPEEEAPTSCDDPKLCDSIPPPPASLATGPVCGPSNSPQKDSYPSYCDMVRAVCEASGGPENLPTESPIKAEKGSCKGTGPPSDEPKEEPIFEPLFTPWTKFGPCEFKDGDCGQGTQVRDRNVAKYPDGRKVREVEPFETKESRTCFKACPEDGENPSDCPEVSICDDVDPVCGSLGLGPGTTFKSACELNVVACKRGVVPVRLYSGDCTDGDSGANRRFCESGPRHETLKYDKERNGIRCLGTPVSIGSCGNMLCEGATTNCCKATAVERTFVKLECHNKDGDQVEDDNDGHIYISATKCECQEKGDQAQQEPEV